MDWEAFYNNFRKPGFISGYEIQNRLGGGAFGDVYKARKQSIGKPYAIKFLKIEDDSQREAVERELSQVRHFAAIDHPNLVTIEDLGSVMGVPFLIMGYAGEDTLARRFKSGRLDRESAILYFVQACRGVLALHDRRLVHFDLKPSNIFLKGDVARVGDYGLSKLLTDGRMTLSFGRGTPQYMAPEILRSRADHRADIYSLGVILYESLTGELPFAADADGGLVLREKDDPPVFPEDFPAVLRPGVERCLRLSPDDRYADVGELLEGIDQTARQGDSVRIDWGTDAPKRELPKSSGEARPTPSTNEDLRQTAADLARGAVEVARGVWTGLTGGKSDGHAGSPEIAAAPTVDAPAPKKEKRLGGIKAELRAAGEEIKAAGAEIRDASAEIHKGIKDGIRGAREGTEKTKETVTRRRSQATEKARALVVGLGLGKGASPGDPAKEAVSSEPASVAGTIPVPPRVEGGLAGTVFSTIVVGVEVLVALVANLLRGIVKVFRATADRLLRRSGGVLSRIVRLALFLIIMGTLGFTVMLVGMIFLDAVGMQ